MNRAVSTLISLGISLAIIAGGIWFLSNHHTIFPYGGSQWHMPHQIWSKGTATIGILILFWITAVTAAALVASGVVAAYFDFVQHVKDKDPELIEKPEKSCTSDKMDEPRFKTERHDLCSILKRG